MNLLVSSQVFLKTRSTDMEENNNKEKLKEDSPSPLPQMGSENVTVGEPAMATESESPPPPQDLRRERPLKEEIQNKGNKFCSVCQVR